MSDNTVRVFVAIELPADVIQSLGNILARFRERVPGTDVKWVAAGSIHLTLKFLGETPASGLEAIRASLESVCRTAPPLRLSVRRTGAFPSVRAPRVVWVGLEGDLAPLAALAGSIDQALGVLGYPAESRPFTPHLTLARVRPEAPPRTHVALGTAIASTSITEQIAFEAQAASLMRSQLTPGGAIYSRLGLFPFGSPRKP